MTEAPCRQWAGLSLSLSLPLSPSLSPSLPLSLPLSPFEAQTLARRLNKIPSNAVPDRRLSVEACGGAERRRVGQRRRVERPREAPQGRARRRQHLVLAVVSLEVSVRFARARP